MINYYRDMIRKRSNLIAPLSKLTSKSNKKFIWTEIEQKAFEQIKEILIHAFIFIPTSLIYIYARSLWKIINLVEIQRYEQKS